MILGAKKLVNVSYDRQFSWSWRQFYRLGFHQRFGYHDDEEEESTKEEEILHCSWGKNWILAQDRMSLLYRDLSQYSDQIVINRVATNSSNMVVTNSSNNC